ncbi:hypothetical protein CLOSTASPAR_04113 [[Clostridium] asparagiforme DSM 15981]|uniref:Uncharacterized protein n=1 Tax=[Clostridium] asparagiforme DSM 15981 TaxID=518636 RepID=C0D4B9_9FIRM|nr:hypothetical protein CLOSTASPAR_04113 [[Clostridium] asparagiforme DSM 15981]
MLSFLGALFPAARCAPFAKNTLRVLHVNCNRLPYHNSSSPHIMIYETGFVNIC